MDSMNAFIDRYTGLEARIRVRMIELFSGTCGICTACCCRADICEEVIQSAFLSLLLEKQGRAPTDMDDRFGWLDLNGCSLEYGRPPVCYAYYCDELLARLPDEDTRWVARILGRLMDYIGENAIDGVHLVEIEDADVLAGLDYDAIVARLDQATATFEIIEQFFETGRLDGQARESLERIGLSEL